MSKKRKSKNKKSPFVRRDLKISFWIMIGIWALYTIIDIAEPLTTSLITMIWIASVVFTFVTSIIHLVRYKPKAFAIVALIFSSILILLIILGYVLSSLQCN